MHFWCGDHLWMDIFNFDALLQIPVLGFLKEMIIYVFSKTRDEKSY